MLTSTSTSTSTSTCVQALRQCAQHRQLDLTDSFEEYAGTGRDANLGVMAKNRFRGAMGTCACTCACTCYMHMHMCMCMHMWLQVPRRDGHAVPYGCRFRGAMGTLFQGINLSSYTLNKICAVYNAGDPDPKEPGTCMKVRCTDIHSASMHACLNPSIHSSIHLSTHLPIQPSIHLS